MLAKLGEARLKGLEMSQHRRCSLAFHVSRQSQIALNQSLRSNTLLFGIHLDSKVCAGERRIGGTRVISLDLFDSCV
jgi:hypothetical protein